jgi:hypothetical protein
MPLARLEPARADQCRRVLAKVTPLDMGRGRFRPDDELMAFLEGR